MKCTSVLLACLAFGSTEAAVPVIPGKTNHVSLKRALDVRGGDLGPIDSKTLAQTFCILASCDALCGALAPVTSMAWAGVEISSGSLEEHYLHGLAASAATTAVSTYLATTGMAVEKAIGYGFIARLCSISFMILTNKYHELGMNNAMFGSMYAVLVATIFSLFTGKGDPMGLTKLVSLLLAVHGVSLYLLPDMFMKAGVVPLDPTAVTMASIDGAYMFVSSVVTGLLANGVDPEKVSGYAALCFLPVLIKVRDVISVEAYLGISTGLWMVAIAVLLGAIATGTVIH